MNAIQKAIQAIRAIESNEELNQVIEAFKLQRTYLARTATRKLMVGDIVGFDAKTRGYITGRVTKINTKTVAVKCSKTGINWKVTASALETANIGG
jgi:uncharacterized protein YkvS